MRRNIPDLPEPIGPKTGTIQMSNEDTKSLVCLGESSVAGVGIASHNVGFTGYIAQNLAEQTGSSIQWTVVAESGYTAAKVHDHLVDALPSFPVDYIVIGLGGNDTFKLNSPLRWYKSMIKLISKIQAQQNNSLILIANMPPVGSFPAFPFVLQQLFDGLITLHGQMADKLPCKFRNVRYASEKINLSNWADRMPESTNISDLFSDGVHPSSLTYELWGKQLAIEIARWDKERTT